MEIPKELIAKYRIDGYAKIILVQVDQGILIKLVRKNFNIALLQINRV
jgi:hypothetical protein